MNNAYINKFLDPIKERPLIFDYARSLSRLIGITDPMYNYIVQSKYLNKKNILFIQIGASDGLRNDPYREHIIKNNWTGVLIEPIPWAYNKLKQNYRYVNNNLTFLNAAISINNKDTTCLYTFSENYLNTLPITKRINYQQKTSFDKEWVLNHSPSEDVVEEIKVKSYSIEQIINDFKIKRDLDLLAIDAEGMDALIIMSLDFNICRPKVIFFEHHTLGDHSDALFDFVKNNGYKAKIIGEWDAVAELN